MTGFNVNIQTHEGATPELIIQYVLPLPAVLLGQSMIDIRNYITAPSATPSLKTDLTSALKANFDTFAETRGSTSEETSALLATAKNALLTTVKNKSLKKQKQTQDPLITEQASSEQASSEQDPLITTINALYNDMLISSVDDLVYEALKNTYDSVIIRNYLASMTAAELQEKEPLVYDVMKNNAITKIDPVTELLFQMHCQQNSNGSHVTMEDNGVGKAIIDAFKLQHSNMYRVRSNQKELEGDDIYDATTGKFRDLYLRTGGSGKGRKTETAILKNIGATSSFVNEDQLGIHLKFERMAKPESSLQKSPSPTFKHNTFSNLSIETKGPEIKKSIGLTGLDLEDSDSEEETILPPISVIQLEDSDSEELDSEASDSEESEPESPIRILDSEDSDSEDSEVDLEDKHPADTPSPLFVPTVSSAPAHQTPIQKNPPKEKWRPSTLLDLNKQTLPAQSIDSNKENSSEDMNNKSSPKKK